MRVRIRALPVDSGRADVHRLAHPASGLAERVGDMVAFFVHAYVVEGGTSAVFTTVGVRVSRLMEVNFNGSPESKRLVIQPTSYMGPGIIIDEDAPSTYGQLGRIELVR